MKYYAGMDVSTQETSICIVDADDVVLTEKVVATDPEEIAGYLASQNIEFERVGLARRGFSRR